MFHTITDKQIKEKWQKFLEENKDKHQEFELSWVEEENTFLSLTFIDLQYIYFSDIKSEENVWTKRFDEPRLQAIKDFFQEKLLKEYGPEQLIQDELDEKKDLEDYIHTEVFLLSGILLIAQVLCISLLVILSDKGVAQPIFFISLMFSVFPTATFFSVAKNSRGFTYLGFDFLLYISIMYYVCVSFTINTLFKAESEDPFIILFLTFASLMFTSTFITAMTLGVTTKKGAKFCTYFRIFIIVLYTLALISSSIFADKFLPESLKSEK